MNISREKFTKIGFLLVFTYFAFLWVWKQGIQHQLNLVQKNYEAQEVPLLHAGIESLQTNQRGDLRSSTDLAAALNQKHQKEIEDLRLRLARVSKALEQLWCDTKDVTSSGGFCVSADKVFTGGNQQVDPKLCYFIEALVGNASLADLGAGLGLYGMCFLRQKETQFRLKAAQKKKYMDNVRSSFGDISAKPQIVHSWHVSYNNHWSAMTAAGARAATHFKHLNLFSIHGDVLPIASEKKCYVRLGFELTSLYVEGFDGAFNIDEVSGGFVDYADLSEEGLWLGRRWDWVMSVEVGEHIPSQYEDYFLDNLVRHTCQGIVVTWAVGGQVGHHHVNNHNNDYIKKKMSDRGLINDIEAEKQLKGALSISYLKNTAMIFRFPNPKSCLNG